MLARTEVAGSLALNNKGGDLENTKLERWTHYTLTGTQISPSCLRILYMMYFIFLLLMKNLRQKPISLRKKKNFENDFTFPFVSVPYYTF